MTSRLSRTQAKCTAWSYETYWRQLTPSGMVWSYLPINLHYCYIPKVGCTFWKRFFLFISDDYPKNMKIERPLDIPRNRVHLLSYPHLEITGLHKKRKRESIANHAFMFSRNPYTRLWSAYIDKFVLPNFWISHARSMLTKVRKNMTEHDRKCGDNMTFLEFLTFITKTPAGSLNEHWKPMHMLCSPCHITYKAIGKLENFTVDSEYVLKLFNMSHLIEKTTKFDFVREEVKSLSAYNFAYPKRIGPECMNTSVIAKKLWYAFQLNGYIHRDAKLPKQLIDGEQFLTDPAEVFENITLATIENQKKNDIDVKLQKHEMMLEAYKKIPTELLDDIIRVYWYDFELFDYNIRLFN
ncbi:hypothetical protein ACF0H5_007823 [Mactra antiquata]